MENQERASFFPATVAYQLCRSRTSCRTAINKATEKRPHIFSEDLPSQFRHLLTKPAQKSGFLQGPVTIVIDGLDECNSVPDQLALLELVLEAVKTGSMRFLIASRPEQHINAFFHRGDVSQHAWHVRLDEETFNTSMDIKIFLREEFARIRRERPEACLHMPNGEDWPGERVLDHLTLESDSQFMFPTLAVAFIDTPFFPPDEQLRVLLTSPPSHAFSALDDLYHKILSRRLPPQQVRGEDMHYQEVVLDILRVIIAWTGEPLSAAKIAAVLNKPASIVQSIVRGPMRSLFKFHTSDLDSPITLCHKSLRDYLLDRERSQEFFIASAEEDELFTTILSRQHSFRPLHSHSPNILTDVLAIIVEYHTCSMAQIISLLDVSPAMVDNVVSSGPTNLLFTVDKGSVGLCTGSFKSFLEDADRSGVLSISRRHIDALFIRFLARYPPPPSDPSNTYSRADLLNILAVRSYVRERVKLTIRQIASFLDVNVSLVERTVKFGATHWLFRMDEHDQVTAVDHRFRVFQQDPHRSGEFFLKEERLDPFFIRILSRHLFSDPSNPHSHDLSMDVLAVIVAFGGATTVAAIADVLDVGQDLVEGAAKFESMESLFKYDQDGVVVVFPSLIDFLTDVDRSGVFFISQGRMDTLFIPFLSRSTQFDPENSYSNHALLDIMALIAHASNTDPWGQLTIQKVAGLLGIDISLVQHIVESGATNHLLKLYGAGTDDAAATLSTEWLQRFLLFDVDHSGGPFVTDERVDRFFIQLLSRHPSSDPSHSPNQGILMDVLTAIVAFDQRQTVGEIASVLGLDSTLVNGVVNTGPTAPLFLVRDDAVWISTRSFQDFLGNADRSGAFCISQQRTDTLFLNFLSRDPTTCGPSHSHPRDILMSVLTVLVMRSRQYYTQGDFTIPRVAAFLDVDPDIVQDVVLGPMKALFFAEMRGADGMTVQLRDCLLETFLKDVQRPGYFCVTERKKDALLISLLSRQPPSNSSLCYTRDDLMDVLTVMAAFPYRELTFSSIASALEVDPQAIERVVFGSSKALFIVQGARVFCSIGGLEPFLLNADRSGEFFISQGRIDALYSRILSRPPPSNPTYSYSRNILMGVLSVMARTSSSDNMSLWYISQLAGFLGVSTTSVEAVVNIGPSKLLFSVQPDSPVRLSSPLLESFLKDAERSREFFISDKSLDPFFIRILSYDWHSSGSRSSTRDVLKDVLIMCLAVSRKLTATELAVALDVNHDIVAFLVEVGPTRLLLSELCHTPSQQYGLFERHEQPSFASPIGLFLKDGERAGELYISDAMIDAVFIRVLSLPPPPHLSHLHSKDVLIGVLATILASPKPLTLRQISALLDVDFNLVEAVLCLGRVKVFFGVEKKSCQVAFLSYLLKSWLRDAARSGEFSIPPTMTVETIGKTWL